MDNDVRQLSLHRDPRGLRDRMFPPQPERWVRLPCLAAFLFIYLFKFFFFEYRSDIEEGASVAANHSLGKHFGACLPFHLDSSWCTIHLCMCVCAYVHMCLQGLHLDLQLVALPAVPGFFVGVGDLNSGLHASTLPTKPSPRALALSLSDFTELEFICHKSHLFSVDCLVSFINRLESRKPHLTYFRTVE